MTRSSRGWSRRSTPSCGGSRAAERALGLALAALLGGCGSPLALAIRADAPGFDPRLPASTDKALGVRVEGGQLMQTNVCFGGDEATDPYASWSNRTLTYTAGGGGDLKVDFDKVVSVDVGASGKRTVGITLSGVYTQRIDGLYFLPASTCAVDEQSGARYRSPEGVVDRVITKILGAATISMNEGKSGGATLKVSGPPNVPISVGPNANGEQVDTWQGVNLVIAHLAQPFRVTRQVAAGCQLGVGTGASCELGTCAFRVDALDSAGADGAPFTGTLACQDATNHPVKAIVGNYAGVKTAKGVSYTVRLRAVAGKPGLFDVDLFLWNVLPL